MIAHWEEVARDEDLAQAAGAVGVSLRCFRLRAREETGFGIPGTEEILFVIAGSGRAGDHDVRAKDCVVWATPHEPQTLRAGDDGLTALVFATPAQPPPFHSGAPDLGRTQNADDADADYEGEAGRWVLLARQAGAVHAGVNWGRLEAGNAGAPPHCHSADEELFVFLEGGATFELWPPPRSDRDKEVLDVRGGHVISRPPGTRLSHYFRAGPEGATFLVYGTRVRTMFATTQGRTRSSGADWAS